MFYMGKCKNGYRIAFAKVTNIYERVQKTGPLELSVQPILLILERAQASGMI